MLQKQKTNFTQISNELLNNEKLSLKAKGLYSHLFSKPNGWDFRTERIAKQSKDGVDGVRSGIHELEKEGFLKRTRQASGRVVYNLYHTPHLDFTTKPHLENPTGGKSHTGKIQGVSNKDNIVIKNNSNKDSSVLKKYTEKDIKLTIFLFQLVSENYSFIKDKEIKDSEYQTMNKLHRIDGYSYEDIEMVIRFSQQDSFWKQNIRSTTKLRKQFETLLIKIQSTVQEVQEKAVVDIS